MPRCVSQSIQACAASSHMAAESADAVSAVETMRRPPVAPNGMPRETYQAERQTKL